VRKILLSAIVIISFITYAVFLRPKNITQTPVIAPTTIGKKVSFPPTATPVPPTPRRQSPGLLHTALPLPTATPQPIIPTVTPQPRGQFRDGTYTGSVADAFYGPIQVQLAISGGRITTVQFLQSPNDRNTSIEINQQADPMLAQEAIQSQSANVDVISGATDTSQAFIQSMQAALSQAKS